MTPAMAPSRDIVGSTDHTPVGFTLAAPFMHQPITNLCTEIYGREKALCLGQPDAHLRPSLFSMTCTRRSQDAPRSSEPLANKPDAHADSSLPAPQKVVSVTAAADSLGVQADNSALLVRMWIEVGKRAWPRHDPLPLTAKDHCKPEGCKDLAQRSRKDQSAKP